MFTLLTYSTASDNSLFNEVFLAPLLYVLVKDLASQCISVGLPFLSDGFSWDVNG